MKSLRISTQTGKALTHSPQFEEFIIKTFNDVMAKNPQNKYEVALVMNSDVNKFVEEICDKVFDMV